MCYIEASMINKDEITEALFVALSGYVKEAYLEGYDNALLNKKTSESPEQLFKDSNVKKQVELIIQQRKKEIVNTILNSLRP